VISKVDLPRAWSVEDEAVTSVGAIEVSALSGVGLSELRQEMARRLTAAEEWRDPPAISNARHLALVDQARAAAALAAGALAAGATEELVLVDLGRARAALEEIVGRRTTEDLLTHIFSRFCIGK